MFTVHPDKLVSRAHHMNVHTHWQVSLSNVKTPKNDKYIVQHYKFEIKGNY